MQDFHVAKKIFLVSICKIYKFKIWAHLINNKVEYTKIKKDLYLRDL